LNVEREDGWAYKYSVKIGSVNSKSTSPTEFTHPKKRGLALDPFRVNGSGNTFPLFG